MSRILELLNEREFIVQNSNKEILSTYQSKLLELITMHFGLEHKPDISWVSIDRYPSPKSTRHVRITGVTYQNIEDGKLKRDDNIKFFSIILPVTKLENSNVDELYTAFKFLSTMKERLGTEKWLEMLDSEEIQESILKGDFDFEKHVENTEDLMEVMTRPDEILGFDATKLTDDQLKSLEIHKSSIKGEWIV